MSDERTRKLRIVVREQLPIYTKPNGATLYGVAATDENGKDVPDLRTFGDLPKGELIEVVAKEYVHPQHGTTWTIQAPSGGVGRRVGELEARLAAAEDRIKGLEARLGEPEPPVHPAQTALDGGVRGPSWDS